MRRAERAWFWGEGGDLLIYGQVGEKGLDFGVAHLGGMAFVVEQDVAPDPVHVGFLGADGIPAQAEGLAEAVGELLFRHCRPPLDSVLFGDIIKLDRKSAVNSVAPSIA